MKFHVKKGDLVKVLSGNSKGKEGKIISMIPDKQRAIVEGVNMITKHLKPTAQNPSGSIEKKESSIHISNLMLIDPSNGIPTRIGRKLNNEGKLQRFSKKTNLFIS
ncbi:MAG TPA: 50S ribosomal protein L24 [Cytophagales bacterium]|jgi:large subunit ribosomal protein L24|nr:50S ribosomal protein L24 [Cytophagales bacterium]